MPWVWLGPLVTVPPVSRTAALGVVAAPDGEEELPWVGSLAEAEGVVVLCWGVPGSSGSGEPGSSLRGASPGPGTTSPVGVTDGAAEERADEGA